MDAIETVKCGWVWSVEGDHQKKHILNRSLTHANSVYVHYDKHTPQTVSMYIWVCTTYLRMCNICMCVCARACEKEALIYRSVWGNVRECVGDN